MYIYLHTLIPRLNKRCLYYLAKIINFKQNKKDYYIVPKAKTQKLLNTYYHS